MVVLLLFSESSAGVMSYTDISKATNMQPSDLKRTLQVRCLVLPISRYT